MAAKRKLPVLNQPAAVAGDGDGGPPRPPWHWVGFGVVLVFAAWLPLAWLAEALKSRIVERLLGLVRSEEEVRAAMSGLSSGARALFTFATVVLPALAMAIGAALAGFVVGRFGDTTTAREAGLAGLASGVLACVLAWVGMGFHPALVVVVPLLGGAAWLGGARGVRRRGPG